MTTDIAPVTGVTPSASYAGPIFDCDSHVHEHDFDFFKEYLPKKYHEKWLLARKVGPDGKFGLLGNLLDRRAFVSLLAKELKGRYLQACAFVLTPFLKRFG